MLCRDQRAQVCASHRAIRARSRVLILNLELCTLHLQETQELEQMLSFLLFADGCAACLVSANPTGLGIDSFLALRIPETSHLITWKIREMGFDMHLSGQVPAEISKAMKEVGTQITPGKNPLEIDLWAVHPGGRTILDAVEKGLGLREDSLRPSREVLASIRQHVLCDRDVCVAKHYARGAFGTTGLRHVVRPRRDCGDNALPCRLDTLDFSRRADLTELMDEPCSPRRDAGLPARSRAN